MWRRARLGLASVGLALAGCGDRTGIPIDESVTVDAGTIVNVDAAVIDANVIPETGAADAAILDVAEAPPVALATRSRGFGGACYGLSVPDAVFLIVANAPVTCVATTPPCAVPGLCPVGAPQEWEFCIALPASQLMVGTFDLGSGDAYLQTVGAQSGGGHGTLSITAVSAGSVAFTLSGTDGAGGSSPPIRPDGTYEAPRCN